jgi:hypothetical protein
MDEATFWRIVAENISSATLRFGIRLLATRESRSKSSTPA